MSEFGVEVDLRVRNFHHVKNKIHGLPKNLILANRDTVRDYFHQDFKPMLSKVLKGFRAANVPAMNSPRYAQIKASVYGIRHSLGILTGFMYNDAMAVEPKISTQGNRVVLTASYDNVPQAGYPYLPIVHEGLGGLHKAYPMVEGARFMTHKKLLKRLDSNVSQAWKKGGK